MDMINTIFHSGDDAIAYEYQITFGPIPYLDAAVNIATIRATTCEIPEQVVGEYEYRYKSEKVVKPNGQIETAKEFTVEFRIDKYYALYKAFSVWNAAIVNPISGGVSPDVTTNGITPTRIPITITTGTYDILGNFVPTLQSWNFTGCWPKAVGGFTLDNQSGEPLMTSIRFGYLSMR